MKQAIACLLFSALLNACYSVNKNAFFAITGTLSDQDGKPFVTNDSGDPIQICLNIDYSYEENGVVKQAKTPYTNCESIKTDSQGHYHVNRSVFLSVNSKDAREIDVQKVSVYGHTYCIDDFKNFPAKISNAKINKDGGSLTVDITL